MREISKKNRIALERITGTRSGTDERHNHRKMLADSERRHFEVLKLIDSGIGKLRAVAELGCSRSKIERSYRYLKGNGYAALVPYSLGHTRLVVTGLGREKLKEMQ